MAILFWVLLALVALGVWKLISYATLEVNDDTREFAMIIGTLIGVVIVFSCFYKPHQ